MTDNLVTAEDLQFKKRAHRHIALGASGLFGTLLVACLLALIAAAVHITLPDFWETGVAVLMIGGAIELLLGLDRFRFFHKAIRQRRKRLDELHRANEVPNDAANGKKEDH